MLMYNVIEYSDNYSKTFGSLYQFCSDDSKDPITDSELHKFKSIFLSNTNNAGTINVEVAVPLKCLSNFWKNLEMFLIDYEIDLILNWSLNFVISERN